jgi:hypothetical protein
MGSCDWLRNTKLPEDEGIVLVSTINVLVRGWGEKIKSQTANDRPSNVGR